MFWAGTLFTIADKIFWAFYLWRVSKKIMSADHTSYILALLWIGFYFSHLFKGMLVLAGEAFGCMLCSVSWSSLLHYVVIRILILFLLELNSHQISHSWKLSLISQSWGNHSLFSSTLTYSKYLEHLWPLLVFIYLLIKCVLSLKLGTMSVIFFFVFRIK